ncbi:hypothetical protein GCM10011578_063760 [Streptomyces fuscichromogenes]|uniref:Uncharacterized protein n=1 Tax=Streptomyces fuscichromogenes TaxID=1324013 RepID=A0A917XI85_9ACTN|nr:hypothetical protein GCM10011578_063760 [Streptomyces fuscichromogenes]
MPDPVPTASGMPESGSGTPDIPQQNGSRPNGRRGSGREDVRRDSSMDGAYIHNRRVGTSHDRSETPPESFLDFLDRLSERVFTKNDRAWPAVFQLALLVLLLPVSLIGTVMAAHAAGVPGWAIASGTATSVGGLGVATASRRRNTGRGTSQGPGRRGGGRRSNRRQGSHRRR